MEFSFLKYKAVGIDISDSAIEVVVANKVASKFSIIKKCQTVLAPGIVSKGKIQNEKALSEAFSALLSQNKINLAGEHLVVFGLPDSQSFVHRFSIKKQKNPDYDTLVFSELVTIVPIPSDDLIFGYTVVKAAGLAPGPLPSEADKEKEDIIGVGADKSVIKAWQNFFAQFVKKNLLIAPDTIQTSPDGKSPAQEYVKATELAAAVLDKNSQTPFFREINVEKSAQKIVPAVVAANKTEKETLQENYDDDGNDASKIKKQKITLLVILLFGIVAVGMAFWYNSSQDKKHKAELASKNQNFSYIHELQLTVPVAVNANEQSKDRAAGRIIENKIEIFGLQDEAVQTSRITALKQLQQGETLWHEPLAVVSATGSAESIAGFDVKNYVIQWLAYNVEGVNSLFTSTAMAEMGKLDVNYSVSNIEKKSVEQSKNSNIYIISGIVMVATDRQVSISPVQNVNTDGNTSIDTGKPPNPVEPSPPIATSTGANEGYKTGQLVTVQKTETGWLNVRQSPSTTSDIITKVYSSETYEVTSQQGDWLEIKLKDGGVGWVASRYLR